MQKLNRILLVEDERDIRMVAKVALHDLAGLEVEMCSSGQEALASIAEIQPDLVLLDVMMPGMDGIELLQALRRIPAFAATPVVFMTAKIQESEIARYRDMGALGVIGKPFDPMTLGSQLRALWRRRRSAH